MRSRAELVNLLCAVIEKNQVFREVVKMAVQLYGLKHCK